MMAKRIILSIHVMRAGLHQTSTHKSSVDCSGGKSPGACACACACARVCGFTRKGEQRRRKQKQKQKNKTNTHAPPHAQRSLALTGTSTVGHQSPAPTTGRFGLGCTMQSFRRYEKTLQPEPSRHVPGNCERGKGVGQHNRHQRLR